jgi:hypothetical protein
MGLPWQIPHSDADVASTNTTPGTRTVDVPIFTMGAFDGANVSRKRTCSVFKPQNAANTNAEITVWTPAAGKRFRLMKLFITGSVAGNYTFRDNTAGTIIAILTLAAGGQFSPVDLDNGILSAAANNVLTCTGPGGSTLSGILCGTEE